MTWDELVDDVTAAHPELKPGSMFGMPCLKWENGKVVAGFWKDGGVTVKLTDEAARERALALDGIELFDPGMGRAMREWVLVPATLSAEWRGLVEQAIQMAAPGRERYNDICDALTAWHEDVRRSVIFGMPCLKKAGRVFAGFTRRTPGMVFKLPDPAAHARALALPGAHLFDPSGRGEPFKEWVVVPPEQADEWEALALDALHAQAPRWENQEPSSSSR